MNLTTQTRAHALPFQFCLRVMAKATQELIDSPEFKNELEK